MFLKYISLEVYFFSGTLSYVFQLNSIAQFHNFYKKNETKETDVKFGLKKMMFKWDDHHQRKWLATLANNQIHCD